MNETDHSLFQEWKFRIACLHWSYQKRLVHRLFIYPLDCVLSNKNENNEVEVGIISFVLYPRDNAVVAGALVPVSQQIRNAPGLWPLLRNWRFCRYF